MLVTFLVVAACLALVLSIVLVSLYRSSQNKTTVPGLEPSDAQRGNLDEIEDAGGLAPFLEQLHARFGPYASFWHKGEYYVSVASPEAIKPLAKLFDRPTGLYEFLRPVLGHHSIQMSNGTEARRRHKVFAEALSGGKLAPTIPEMEKICNELADLWAGLPAEEHIHPLTYTTALSVKMLSKTQFGSFFKTDSEVNKLYKVFLAAAEGGFQNNDDEDAIDELHQVASKLLSEHDSARAAAPLLNAILDPSSSGSAKQLHPDVVSQELGDLLAFMVGGFQTVGNALAWIVHHMTLHPEVQDEMHDELKEVLGDSALDDGAVRRLKYTKKVVDETLRLVRLMPFAARVSSGEEIRVGGHLLPPGINVVFALHVALHDPEQFPDPERFNPDRSSGDAGLAFSPFGFGLRQCPGRDFAYAEIIVAVAVLFRRFRFVAAGGKKDFSVRPEFGFITKPDRDFWISVERR